MTSSPTLSVGTKALSVAVVVCSYSEKRFGDLELTMASIDRQSRTPDEVIIVIDHDEALLARTSAAFPDATVIENDGGSGLAGARNSGAEATTTDVVAFLDDDVVAEPGWLAEAMGPLEDPHVVGVGCRIDPQWDEGRPGWFPFEFLWVVGCDYRGMRDRGEIRNPIGAAMLVRRDAIVAVGGFGAGLGRTATTLDGCEETDLAIRIKRQDESARFVRAPEAVVVHRVTRDRHTLSYFLRRCFSEGRSKRRLARRVGADAALSAERGHVVELLLRGVPREVTGLARGDLGGPARAVALIVGLGATTLGYVAGSAGDA